MKTIGDLYDAMKGVRQAEVDLQHARAAAARANVPPFHNQAHFLQEVRTAEQLLELARSVPLDSGPEV